MKIPPETQTEKIFKLKDLGAGSLRGKVSGDLYVRVVVETPEKLSSKQKKSIQEAFQDSENNFHESASFKSKINKKLSNEIKSCGRSRKDGKSSHF